ncbi:DUF3592 domain-containing protein [Actinomycetospora sp. NBRC 106378]|uniref:DUF3592 domain-containing protein n=1 Tax=Actinomycetospora sp. NBRC 106378 TaxID=3032208 RepID=UPI0024A2AAD0|nr:DUF3592 domain-containing protein [Actinomycetospora sp. NBRC 106378]GLZ50910.1 hypothetical protein Acsp07_05270 [Actinomycetospora sp. NBRC 106378]
MDLRATVDGRFRALRAGARTAWDVTGTALAPVARRAAGIVVGIGLVLSVLAVLVLVGAARNDASISADEGTTVAEVLDGGDAGHTFVRFTASDGAVLTPATGVLYPRGLEPGQYVVVEYDRSKPELVRVAGRSWTEGLGPVALGVVGLWVVLGPTAWALARRRRAAEAATVPAPDDDVTPDREPVGAVR